MYVCKYVTVFATRNAVASSKLAHQVRPAVATAVKFLWRARRCKIHVLLQQNPALCWGQRARSWLAK